MINDFGQLHIDKYLTNFSLQLPQGNLIFPKLNCIVNAVKKSDKIRFRGFNNFNIYQALRKGKSPANIIDRSEGIALTYFSEERALKDIVLQEDIDNVDDPIILEEETVEDLTFSINLLLEKEIADILRDTNNLENDSLSGTKQWNDYDNSTPYQDLRKILENGWKKRKVKFNKIILPYSIALTLSQHPDTKEMLKYTIPGDRLIFQDIILPTQILGMEVVIATTSYNTSNSIKDYDLQEIWGNDVICLYQEDAKRNTYSTFKVFQYKDLTVKTAPSFDPEGKVIIVSRHYDIKLIDGKAGFLLQSVIS